MLVHSLALQMVVVMEMPRADYLVFQTAVAKAGRLEFELAQQWVGYWAVLKAALLGGM